MRTNFVLVVTDSVTLTPSGRITVIEELDTDCTVPRSRVTVTYPFVPSLTRNVAWTERRSRRPIMRPAPRRSIAADLATKLGALAVAALVCEAAAGNVVVPPLPNASSGPATKYVRPPIVAAATAPIRIDFVRCEPIHLLMVKNLLTPLRHSEIRAP